MKMKINVNLSMVEKYINEGVAKTMEKSGKMFKSLENIQEVGKVTLDSKEYIIFTANADDKAIGANYRIGEKIGKEYKSRPVMIDLNNNSIKIAKDENSWTTSYRIKSIKIEVPEDAEEVVDAPEETDVEEPTEEVNDTEEE